MQQKALLLLPNPRKCDSGGYNGEYFVVFNGHWIAGFCINGDTPEEAKELARNLAQIDARETWDIELPV